MTTYARPPRDPELEAVVSMLPPAMLTSLTFDAIDSARSLLPPTDLEAALTNRGLVSEDRSVPGHDGGTIVVSIIRRADADARPRGAVYYTHGGGMISGDRWSGIDMVAEIVLAHDVVGVTVDYRLAPEFPDPYPVEDCYAGLRWLGDNADELRISSGRVLIMGSSAGGGLAAGTALIARDRGGPELAGQLLICPMIDDRDATTSTLQMDGGGIWDRQSNRTGWEALLGARRGGPDVTEYAAPSRTDRFDGLPRTFIDAGAAEVFRDEAVAYASGLWAAGVDTELHVWAGGFHGFDAIAPHAAVSRAALAARTSWLERLFS